MKSLGEELVLAGRTCTFKIKRNNGLTETHVVLMDHESMMRQNDYLITRLERGDELLPESEVTA